MKLGNPLAVRALIGLVTVAMVYDGYSYVTHQAHASTATVKSEAPAPAPATVPVAVLPNSVNGNPFFHPALLLKAGSKQPNSLAGAAALPGISPFAAPLALQKISSTPASSIGTSNTSVISSNGPANLGGPAKPHAIYVGATVDSQFPVALISIDGAPSIPFRAGDLVIDHVRVVTVVDGRVTVEISGKTLTIHVGQRLQP